MSGVAIEQRPGLGNVLLATRQFQEGDVVVQEQPLLNVPQLKPSNPLYKPLQVGMQRDAGIHATAALHCCRQRLLDCCHGYRPRMLALPHQQPRAAHASRFNSFFCCPAHVLQSDVQGCVRHHFA